jgi:hypothetical protein
VSSVGQACTRASVERLVSAQGELCDLMIWSLFADDYRTTPSASAHVRIYGADGVRLAQLLQLVEQ